MCESRLISFEEARRLLAGLSLSAIRDRKAGTENLTHVPGFGRRVFLIREEVLALVDQRIAQALAIEQRRQETLHSLGVHRQKEPSS